MKQTSLALRSRLNSFRFAIHGIGRFFRSEANARLHLFATIAVTAASVFFHVKGFELLVIIVVAGAVWVTEILNTAIEKLVDLISPRFHPGAGAIKDLAAAAVLIASLTALITGAIIFIPKIFNL